MRLMVTAILMLYQVQLTLQDLVHVIAMSRHGNSAAMMKYQIDEYQQNGHSSLTPTGMRQQYIHGMMYRSRYLNSTENQGFLDHHILEQQFTISSSDVSRTQQSSQAFFMGFLNNGVSANATGPQLSNRQMRSFKEGKIRTTLKISNEIETRNNEQHKQNALPEGFKPYFSRTYAQTANDKINVFSCPFLIKQHLYIANYANEQTYWSHVLDHYFKIGILDKMAQATKLPSSNLFKYLGFQLAYDISVHMSSLRQQYPMSYLGYENLTYADWNQIDKVLMTHQYGITSRAMSDLQNTRALKLWLSQFETKITCILDARNQLIDHRAHCKKMIQLEQYFQHDINLLAFGVLFNLEQDGSLIDYASTLIFELHYDSSLLIPCTSYDCFHIKIQWNMKPIFAEVPFCDSITGRCPYSKFKKYVQDRYIDIADTDEICYAPFDPILMKYHRVQIL